MVCLYKYARDLLIIVFLDPGRGRRGRTSAARSSSSTTCPGSPRAATSHRTLVLHALSQRPAPQCKITDRMQMSDLRISIALKITKLIYQSAVPSRSSSTPALYGCFILSIIKLNFSSHVSKFYNTLVPIFVIKFAIMKLTWVYMGNTSSLSS